MGKNCYTTISLLSHTNSGVKIIALFTQLQNLQEYLYIFVGGKAPKDLLFSKKPNIGCFLFNYLLQLELWNIKSKFAIKLLVFLGHDMTICVLFTLDKQFILQVWSSFHAKFGHKDKSFIQVQKCERKKMILPLHPFF